jgi:4-hydroxy-3-polyprenylbenzoate decarboxylase
MGAIVAPPVPGFYRRPQTVAEIIDATAARAIDLLGLGIDLDRNRWSGLTSS